MPFREPHTLNLGGLERRALRRGVEIRSGDLCSFLVLQAERYRRPRTMLRMELDELPGLCVSDRYKQPDNRRRWNT